MYSLLLSPLTVLQPLLWEHVLGGIAGISKPLSAFGMESAWRAGLCSGSRVLDPALAGQLVTLLVCGDAPFPRHGHSGLKS